MISSLYAGLLACLMVWLTVQVIKLRRAKKVRLGDGGEPELQIAIRAHGNATETIPIGLILLILLEFSGACPALIHAGGIALLAGRVLHARGILAGKLRYRILGMKVTIHTLIGLALANVGAYVYASLIAR